nr:hypothetical protein Iba_chr14aCG17770 [Ipomoea batatas]
MLQNHWSEERIIYVRCSLYLWEPQVYVECQLCFTVHWNPSNKGITNPLRNCHCGNYDPKHAPKAKLWNIRLIQFHSFKALICRISITKKQTASSGEKRTNHVEFLKQYKE